MNIATDLQLLTNTISLITAMYYENFAIEQKCLATPGIQLYIILVYPMIQETSLDDELNVTDVNVTIYKIVQTDETDERYFMLKIK